MIINLARRDGDTLVLEDIGDGVMFEGGQPQPGVIVTFSHEGQEISARIAEVTVSPGGESIVTIVEIDQPALDQEAEITLEKLPPESDLFEADAPGQPDHLPPRKPI